MALTQEQIDKYVNEGWNTCPYCGSTDIFAGPYQADRTEAWSEITCESCERRWLDIHTLTNIVEVEE